MKLKLMICCFLVMQFGIANQVEAKASKATVAQANAKAFGHLPLFQHAKVSPNGEKVAAVYNSAEGPQVTISDFGSRDIATIVRLKKAQDRIDSIRWANDERLLISASYSKKLGSDFIRINRLFAVNIDGTNLIELKNKYRRGNPVLADIYSNKTIVSILKDDDKNVLIETYDERDEAKAVFKVDIYENKFDKQFINKYNVTNWAANGAGEVVLGSGPDRSNAEITKIWFRSSAKEEWKNIRDQKAFASDYFNPVVVKDDKLYVISDHKLYRKALWLYDIPTGNFEKLLYAHDKYDVSNVILDPKTQEVIGVYYSDDFFRSHFFNDSDSQILNIVKNSFPNFETSITSMDKDRKKILITAQNNTAANQYFWLDLEKKKAGLWFADYPYLVNKKLAATQNFSFEASDGMEIHGYITAPTNVEAGKAPLVVFPHGGPFGVRDYKYFDPYVQYMVSLGYAVMQVNFRGSGGFGNEYQVAGYRQWGKEMQRDVYEAIDHVATLNVADTKNSCLVGASYGGYVALTASFQRPDQFKCIVSIAGISDLRKLAEAEFRYKGGLRAFIRETIGDLSKEGVADELYDLSAFKHIDKIKAPILLIHGTYDTQVYYRQSTDFYEEGKEKGLDIKYVHIDKGTHYLDDGENRMLAFSELGTFLAEYLN